MHAFLSLAAFQILSLSLVLSSLIMMCLGINCFMFNLLGFFFLNLLVYSFHQNLKIFVHYFYSFFWSLPSFGDFNHTYTRLLQVILHLTVFIFFQKIFLFLSFCFYRYVFKFTILFFGPSNLFCSEILLLI